MIGLLDPDLQLCGLRWEDEDGLGTKGSGTRILNREDRTSLELAQGVDRVPVSKAQQLQLCGCCRFAKISAMQSELGRRKVEWACRRLR